MLDHIRDAARAAFDRATGDETLLVRFDGEDSDFVRLNGGRVRQPGSVRQGYAELVLVAGGKQASAKTGLAFDDGDGARLVELLERLRARLDQLPSDPHLLVDEDPREDVREGPDPGIDAAACVEAALALADGLDLVGLWSSGSIHRGLLSSRGHVLSSTTHPFLLDWSLYHQADKAVKCGYGGVQWDEGALAAILDDGRRKLEGLKRPPKELKPGSYRVWLEPAAVAEPLGMMSWGGFSVRSQRRRTSCLQQLVDGKRSLHPSVSITENVTEGLAPAFDDMGFARPDAVQLVVKGQHNAALVDSRSAREFDLPCTGAGNGESPDSLDLAAGELDRDRAAELLGTGLLVGNLHYLNFSDRPAARVTGMTRFATFWVEGGEVQAPVSVLRFDDTLFNLLGDRLVGLSKQREFLPHDGTYERRSTISARVPAALVDGMQFTL